MAHNSNPLGPPVSPEDDAFTRRQHLVDLLQQGGCLSASAVEAAFRAVPRHLFLPGIPLDTVYANEAITTKYHDGLPISSSSQPAVMATMLEQLDVHAGQHILEIGAGTGYNAALLATLAGDEGQVVTIDIDDDVVSEAQEHLRVAGFAHVWVVSGDGALGYRDAAPYDRIILTVGSWDIAPAWIDQLKPGGRLLLPLVIQSNVQQLVAFERTETHLQSLSVRSGGFMPLRGIGAGPPTQRSLRPTPGLNLTLGDEPRAVDADAVYALLVGPSAERPTSLHVSREDLWSGINLWLALQAPTICHVAAMGSWAEHNVVPDLLGGASTFHVTMGLVDETSLCLLMWSSPHAYHTASHEPSPDTAPWTLAIRRYGPNEQLAERLEQHLMAWETAGRPSLTQRRISAYPQEVPYVPRAGEMVIAKRWSRLVLDWP
jgi:protein-L-isoaspartate(D-aspartate) O-methyltransferase